MTNEELRKLPDYEHRMSQARARAQWSLGDPGWAAVIIGAFIFPEADAEALDAEKAEFE